MRRAYFVMGPESSGTRVMMRLLLAAGCWGDADHPQRLDNLKFVTAPDRIVFRRSVPHAMEWPPIAEIVGKMQAAGYGVTAVVTTREWNAMMKSQVRAGHVPNLPQAMSHLQLAHKHIFTQLAETTAAYVMTSYEALVQRPNEFLQVINEE